MCQELLITIHTVLKSTLTNNSNTPAIVTICCSISELTFSNIGSFTWAGETSSNGKGVINSKWTVCDMEWTY